MLRLFFVMNMYYVAILAPGEIDQQVLKWKNYFKEHYGCTVALKSPAHVTIVPPFWMKEDLENELIKSIDEFWTGQDTFEINLKGFSTFKPKVIFIDVEKHDALISLRKEFNNFILQKNKFPIEKDDRPFHPHVTLATRDLHKKAFNEAWNVFSEKKYAASWSVNGISLLRHNKKNWNVIFTSQ
jgi:2'-5' RNA ligase